MSDFLDQKFQAGQIVKLKSGGPDMTVKSFNTPGAAYQYTCQWFSGKKLEQGHFIENTLELVPESSEGK